MGLQLVAMRIGFRTPFLTGHMSEPWPIYSDIVAESLLSAVKALIGGRPGIAHQSLPCLFKGRKNFGFNISNTMAAIDDIDKLREYILMNRSTPWAKVD
ncbi:MAG: hypothetical protein HOP09_10700 [Hyphomicrobium sp.]|nr:hypothetical protein [Hyphomicrobium sp.]